ncbi:uncharacterized protein LOC108988603 [Juglans regia]|uniref:Uncharacterized protein LOC108988603 n=1 Tax=Juglans regia TaxID=51240 RepID=A0A2I4EDI0_JUGRE|nr:uncharacterized protein LOC108988603 [Juglans regia]
MGNHPANHKLPSEHSSSTIISTWVSLSSLYLSVLSRPAAFHLPTLRTTPYRTVVTLLLFGFKAQVVYRKSQDLSAGDHLSAYRGAWVDSFREFCNFCFGFYLVFNVCIVGPFGWGSFVSL